MISPTTDGWKLLNLLLCLNHEMKQHEIVETRIHQKSIAKVALELHKNNDTPGALMS